MAAKRGSGSGETGQGLVEFALVIPIFLFLLFGTVEFGRAWMTRNIMTGAAREAVRVAAVVGSPDNAVSRANEVLGSAGITGARVAVASDPAPFGTCRATVSYDFPLYIPLFANRTLGISTTTSMRKEY